MALTTVMTPEPEDDNPLGGRPTEDEPPTGPISPEVAEALDLVEQPMPMWLPGIVYLGQGTSNEILPNAKQANLDLLLHFDVVLKEGRNDYMQNLSRCRLINVSTGKSMGISKGMDSAEAARLAATGRSGERRYVEDQLANLIMIIDRSAKTTDLPRLSPAVAKKRVASLMAGRNSRSLRTLAEIRLYHAQQLISDDEVEIAFDIIGGPEALVMLHGPRHERVAMARKWALRSQGVQFDDE